MEAIHQHYMQKCYTLARNAIKKGNHPFAALLCYDGNLLLVAENTVGEERDITRHAELNLVSHAVRELDQDILQQSILYTSTEPCAMCAGAIYWAEISTVVYGCSAQALAKIVGKSLLISCREIFARGQRQVKVIGPILEEEGITIHSSFW